MEIVFKEFRNRFLLFLLMPLDCFSDILSFENKLENETIFDEIQNLKFWIWWCISVSIWAL